MSKRTPKPWHPKQGGMEYLRNIAHETAIRTELTPQFPGVDIDAIHFKRGAVKPGVKQRT